MSLCSAQKGMTHTGNALMMLAIPSIVLDTAGLDAPICGARPPVLDVGADDTAVLWPVLALRDMAEPWPSPAQRA